MKNKNFDVFEEEDEEKEEEKAVILSKLQHIINVAELQKIRI